MYRHYFKRLFDIVILIIASVMCSWLFVLILLLYVATLQFPIFFFHERIGFNSKPFVMFKFRTLKPDTQIPLNERQFWLGKVLRFLSLDEIPQLLNILHGEMSFIGPRPLPLEYLPLLNEQQRERHKVRPGITGWTQVQSRHQLSWKEKFEFDKFYVNNISLKLDLIILMRTVFLLLTPRRDVSLLEEKFKGN